MACCGVELGLVGWDSVVVVWQCDLKKTKLEQLNWFTSERALKADRDLADGSSRSTRPGAAVDPWWGT